MLKNYCYYCLFPAPWKNAREQGEFSFLFPSKDLSKTTSAASSYRSSLPFFHSIVSMSQNYEGRKEAKIPLKQCWVNSNKNDLPLFIGIYELTSLHLHFHYLGIHTDSQS